MLEEDGLLIFDIPTIIEALSAGNPKATWVSASAVDWPRAEGREFLYRATQVKNIWAPYGE